MIYRTLGKTGLRVSILGFGCQDLAGSFYRRGGREPERTLRAALDAGVTYFDTADMYGFGESERILGRILKGRRSDAVIATKGGYRYTRAGRAAGRLTPFLSPLYPLYSPLTVRINRIRRGFRYRDFSAASLKKAVHGSLRRLGTDYIDLYQLHDPPAGVLEKDEAFACLEKLRKEGKIRHYGVSCVSNADAVKAAQREGPGAVQLTVNLLDRSALREAVPAAARAGLGVVARIPFAQGLLTGAKDTKAAFTSENPSGLVKERARAEKFRFLEAEGGTLAQAALRFLFAQEALSSVAAGMTRLAHLEENLAAVSAPPLSSAALARIEQSS